MKETKGIKENLWSARLNAGLHFIWGKGGLRWLRRTLLIETNLKRLFIHKRKAMQKSVTNGNRRQRGAGFSLMIRVSRSNNRCRNRHPCLLPSSCCGRLSPCPPSHCCLSDHWVHGLRQLN